MKHMVAELPLSVVLEHLIAPLQWIDARDSLSFRSTTLAIKRYLEDHPDATCSVFNMSKGIIRERGVENGKIKNVHQGPHPNAQGRIYKGDRNIFRGPISIQIHSINLVEKDENGNLVERLGSDLKVIAIKLTRDVDADLVIQR
jgi:hypothetical protein